MIQVKEISKSFGEIQALKGISFSIKKGEIFGLLGPNGAGKSTTINILNTLLKADSGEIVIDGLMTSQYQDECKIKLGVVPQEIALYEELSAFDNLMFWGSLYNISKSELKQRANKTLDLVGLSDRKNDTIKTYSGGMKRRINIASALLHNPMVLLMDEPTVGVDPQSRNRIFEVIEKLNSEGMTIIYTTHYMEEAERLCDSIAIIDEGEIAASGTLNELRTISKVKDILTIKLTNLESIDVSSLESSMTLIENNRTSNTLKIECQDIGLQISSILSGIQGKGGIIESIDTQKANLETIFLKLTGKQLRD